jgi:3-hydroxyacyl-CoA dehydrogenase / enoyl-CoA hydratase / 3-hydroxybutyryl-CoA epimerase
MASKKNQHWRLNIDDDNIAWLHFDKAGSSTNALGREVVDELAKTLDEIEALRPQGLVILSDKKNGFIAGADIHEFTTITNDDEARELLRRGQSVINRFADCAFPSVALMHGFCLGGGLELALACDYRIADEATSSKFGLPEVRLGIHPGFGGAARLPPLVGAVAAMDLMLSGRVISARAAKKIGLIDYALPARQLPAAARSLIQNTPTKACARGWKSWSNHALVRPLLARVFRQKVAKKAARVHYPAPYALIDLWLKHGGDVAAMLRGEELSVARLVRGDSAQNLIRVFLLQEKLKACGDKTLFTPMRVHVIGAGVMGGDIAAWCALQGMHVTVQDRQESTLAKVVQRAAALYQKKLKKPRLVQQVLDRLTPDIHGLGIRQADVVIEAIFENVEAKQALYRELEPKMKAGALLATNTSSIPLETLNVCLAEPSRLVGIHFFNPVAMMQLVEIVVADNADPHAVDQATAFTRHINRLPLLVRSTPGFLVNRVLMPYLLEAVVMESEGISAEAIDQVALDFGMPVGPIALADTVGLDICLAVAETLSTTLYKDRAVEVPARLRELVDSGRLGKKSGQGFYDYRTAKKGQLTAPKSAKGAYYPSDIQDRLIMRLINEARACLRESVVADKDLVDAGIIFGTGFAPFRGGPMQYADTQGIETLTQKMCDLHKKHGERFNPDASWQSVG